MRRRSPTGGSAGTLPAATPLTRPPLLFGNPSRRVSSWFFGDGTYIGRGVYFRF